MSPTLLYIEDKDIAWVKYFDLNHSQPFSRYILSEWCVSADILRLQKYQNSPGIDNKEDTGKEVQHLVPDTAD
jgi:hypothetical protein